MTGGLDQLAVRIGRGLGRKQTVDEQQFHVERHLGHDRERPRSFLAYVGSRRGGGNRHRGKRGRLLRGKRHRRPKIGRASGWESGCQQVEDSVVAVSLKKKQNATPLLKLYHEPL